MTPESKIHLEDVSVRFRSYSGKTSGLKETVMRWLHPPDWQKKANTIRKNEFYGLRNVSLHLEHGDRLGIVGRNGAGKSTLLKVISRIYRPTSGSISVVGRIAPLIEIGAGFNPELSGKENIFLNGAVLGLSKKKITERLDSIVEFSELAEFIEMPVKYYSTGMHLKLAFTVATEIPPDILILDEMYAGGDAAFIQKANVRMQNFVERSSILIMVAHNLEYIRQFCNRVIVLDHGRIIGAGDPNEMTDRYLALCAGDTGAFGGGNA
jgi:ABC-type polysaccharide/polyol phosphate transport system ATPase subunit